MNKNKWLALLCLAQLGNMMVILNYSAVLPILKAEWGLSNTEAGMIFSSYQIGYISLVIFLSILTDFISAKYIYVFSAFWAGMSSLLFTFFAHDLWTALVFRTMTGIGLAGTYMPGLRLVSEKFTRENRGRAVGFYVGAFTFGSSLSLMFTGLLTDLFSWQTAFLITSIGPIVGGLVAFFIIEKKAPEAADKKVVDIKQEIPRNKPALLMAAAYFGHMWEMYGMRGWIAAFLGMVLVASGFNENYATSMAAIVSAIVIGSGAFSTIVAGSFSDRKGRVNTIIFIMLVSSFCSLAIGWTTALPVAVTLLLALLYGLFTNAETSVISTSVTELATPAFLGTFMAIQSFLGWTAASISPIVFGYILDIAGGAQALGTPGSHWGLAFSMLGIGALIGPLAMYILKIMKREASAQNPENSKLAVFR